MSLTNYIAGTYAVTSYHAGRHFDSIGIRLHGGEATVLSEPLGETSITSVTLNDNGDVIGYQV